AKGKSCQRAHLHAAPANEAAGWNSNARRADRCQRNAGGYGGLALNVVQFNQAGLSRASGFIRVGSVVGVLSNLPKLIIRQGSKAVYLAVWALWIEVNVRAECAPNLLVFAFQDVGQALAAKPLICQAKSHGVSTPVERLRVVPTMVSYMVSASQVTLSLRVSRL